MVRLSSLLSLSGHLASKSFAPSLTFCLSLTENTKFCADAVVENATLSAVKPPDVTYNLAMPVSILSEGKMSNIQLEAIVYGCQHHLVDLPTEPVKNDWMSDVGDGQCMPLRTGELLK